MTEKLRAVRLYALLAMPYCMIFTMAISNVLIGIIALLTLITCGLEKSWRVDYKQLLVAVIPGLITLAGMIYTADPEQGWKDVETRASLLLLPLIFNLGRPSDTEVKVFIRHFIFALLVSFSAAVAIALYRNSLDPKGFFVKYYFQYNDFTDNIDIDPLYISLYLSIGIILLELDLLRVVNLSLPVQTAVKVLFVVLLLLFMAMVGARSWILVTMVVGVIAFLLRWKFHSGRTRVLFVAVFSTFLIVAALLPVTRERFEGIFTNQFDFSSYTTDRQVIWGTALDYVFTHPGEFIFGVGTGASNGLMDRLYLEQGVNWDFVQKNNTHNQYINFLLNQGFIGLLLFLYYMVFTVRYFLKQKMPIGVVFITLVALGFLFENYLDRQKGVVFIALAYSLLIFNNQKQGATNLANEK